jgi:hypothetical protein
MHPLGVVAVLPERAGTAVRTVVKTTVDTLCRMGTGVTHRGSLSGGVCLGLCLTACSKDVVVFGLVRSSTNSAQLGFEGAHHGTMAIPPTPGADGDSNPHFSREDGEGDVAKHKATALEAAEALAT